MALRALAQAGVRTIFRLLESLSGPPQFSCPVCGKGVRRFLPLSEYFHQQLRDAGWPYGLDRAETLNIAQYSCPHCHSSDRDRLMAIYATRWLRAETRPVHVIEFAPAPALSRMLRSLVQQRNDGSTYRTADLQAEGVDDRVDLMNLSRYDEGSIDLLLCSHVLEHVRDDRRAMSELFRVLKHGGKGVLLVPIVLGLEEMDEDVTVTDPIERWRRFGQDDHLRLYSKKEFIRRLEATGFVVDEVGIRALGEESFGQAGLAPQSLLYIVGKPP